MTQFNKTVDDRRMCMKVIFDEPVFDVVLIKKILYTEENGRYCNCRWKTSVEFQMSVSNHIKKLYFSLRINCKCVWFKTKLMLIMSQKNKMHTFVNYIEEQF